MHNTQQAWNTYVRQQEISKMMRQVLTEKKTTAKLNAYPKTFERKASQ